MKRYYKFLLPIVLISIVVYFNNKLINKSIEVSAFNFSKNIEQYIPDNAELQKPIYPKKSRYIMYDDLYGDKEKEIIITLKDKECKDVGGFIVLKKQGNGYEEVFREYGKNKNIYEVTFADLDGDNKDELLVGFSTKDPLTKILKVYKYSEKENKIKQISTHNYSKLDVKLMDKDNKKSDIKKVAIWNNLEGDVYIINVLKYEEGKMVESKEDYPYYFNKVAKYYKSKLHKNKDSATMWYYLVDAQIKANKQKEALNSIYEVKKIKPKGYENMEEMFKELEKLIVDNFK